MLNTNDEISAAAAGQVLGLTPRQVRRLADEHDLAIERDAAGRRRLSASRVAALAVARATQKKVRP